MTRVDRHLLKQVAHPFLVALALVIALVFLFQARRLATAALGLGLTLGDVITIFLAALPPFLVLAIPIAYLLAVLLGMGKLTADLEIVALRAAGAGALRITRAPLLLGVFISIACVPIAIFGEPYGLRLLHNRLVEVGLRNLTQAIRPGVFSEDFRGSAVYAREQTEDGTLRDVLLFDERDPDHRILMTADRGRVAVDRQNRVVFRLDHGEMHFGSTATDRTYDRIRFDDAELALDAADEIYRKTKFVSIIGRLTMTEMRQIFEGQAEKTAYIRRVEQTYWRRFAFPTMAFVFGFVGVAIVLSGDVRARVRSAVLGMLAVVAYYVSTRIADISVVNDVLSPATAAWAPNVVFLLLSSGALAWSGRPR